MTRLTRVVYVLLLSACAASGGVAQTPPPPPPQPQPSVEDIRRTNARPPISAAVLGTNSPPPAAFKRRALGFKKRLSGEQKKRLAPDAADVSRHASFIESAPRAGLMKLFPDLDCEADARVVRADETCLGQIPMSAFYSFREREHTVDYLADIRLKDGILVTDGLMAQGILVRLGEVPLETVTAGSEGLRFLNEFRPEAAAADATAQTQQLINGIEADGYVYRKGLAAREHHTYVLRVVAYRGKIVRFIRGFPYNMLEGDDRADVTVAFRLLKKDRETGAYTVLWKELARRDAPKIVLPKRNKNPNFQRTR